MNQRATRTACPDATLPVPRCVTRNAAPTMHLRAANARVSSHGKLWELFFLFPVHSIAPLFQYFVVYNWKRILSCNLWNNTCWMATMENSRKVWWWPCNCFAILSSAWISHHHFRLIRQLQRHATNGMQVQWYSSVYEYRCRLSSANFVWDKIIDDNSNINNNVLLDPGT